MVQDLSAVTEVEFAGDSRFLDDSRKSSRKNSPRTARPADRTPMAIGNSFASERP